MVAWLNILPLASGWIADRILGDPSWLPHPIIAMGKCISCAERRLNKGDHRKTKGAVTALGLIALTYSSAWLMLHLLSGYTWALIAVQAILIFFCLAGTTLANEVRMVFTATDRSLDDGRRQVGRIVGRDTARLSAQEVRTAALETLAENLSDGVVAPLFWYAIAGVPGMLAYKMINTLDSMIGYRNERYADFGCWSARIDDIANWIPARITAALMALLSGTPRAAWLSILRYRKCHASPNSGYPEAALAGALDCRFGGTHDYFGSPVYKPYIGSNPREITTTDCIKAIAINRRVEIASVILVALTRLI